MRSVRTLLPGLLVACFLPLIALAADDPAAPYRELRLSEGALTVAPGSVRFGHLEIEFTDGQLSTILSRNGECVGFQFGGHGIWRYAVKEREARQTFRDNAERVSKAYDVSSEQVRDKFKTATVLFARPAFESLWKDAVPGTAVPGGKDELQKTLDLMDLSQVGFDHFAAEARLGTVAGQQFVYIEFDGGEAPRTGYEYDGVIRNKEWLYGFVKNDFGRFAKPIVNERIAAIADRVPWMMEHVDLTVDTPDNQTGSIKTALRLRVQEPGVRVPMFILMNHRNRRAYGWRSNENVLNVRRVTDETGKELPFSHRYGEIIVDVGEPLAKDAVKTLTFETDGDVFTAVGGRRGDNYLDLFASRWFPSAPDIAQRRYTFEIEMRTKKPFVPVVSGETVSLTGEGDRYVFKAKSDIPIWALAAFAGKYETSEVKNDRWTVRAHSYGAATKEDRDRVARMAAQFIEIYESMLGPFPVKELDLVEFPTMSYFGISPSGLIVLTSRWFSPREWEFARELARVYEDYSKLNEEFFSNRGLNVVLAHEIAHQWFGHVAWPRHAEDTWLDESCAEYMAGLAIGVATEGAKINRAKVQDFKGKLDDWRSWNGQIKSTYGISAADHDNDDAAFGYRTYLLYNRGPLVLHMLRTLVGDKRFLDIMRQYLADAKLSPRTTDDFAASASKVLGSDFHWFFDQWFRDPGMPHVKVEQHVESAATGSVLKVHLGQPAGDPFKKIHVPFVLTFPDGHREVRLAFEEQRSQDFTFPLPVAPSKVEVDPSHNNLAVYEQ